MIISIAIPSDSKVLVKKDDKLDFNTPLFDKKINKEIQINIATELGINPKNIFRYLTKLVGEEISKNDLLALKKGMFFSKKVKSTYNGIIKEIDHHQGILIINSVEKSEEQVYSPVKGVIEKVNKNNLEVSISKGVEFDLKKSSNDFGGEAYYLKEDQFFDITSSDIESKVVVASSIASFTQTKAEALGAKGFVTLESLPNETDLTNLAQIKNIKDTAKIQKEKLTYCTILSKPAKIYFYE